jgi:hypothetical protein
MRSRREFITLLGGAAHRPSVTGGAANTWVASAPFLTGSFKSEWAANAAKGPAHELPRYFAADSEAVQAATHPPQPVE